MIVDEWSVGFFAVILVSLLMLGLRISYQVGRLEGALEFHSNEKTASMNRANRHSWTLHHFGSRLHKIDGLGFGVVAKDEDSDPTLPAKVS